MSRIKFAGLTKWVVLAVLAVGGGANALAQDDATATQGEQPTGKIVRIGPAGGSNITIPGDVAENQNQMLPTHWIGILGGPVTDELRAQVDIPENQGVLVRQVVPGSPAEKAGLKAFDILLRANDADLRDVGDLTDLVKSVGEAGGQIKLDVMRRGQLETLNVTPESRPDQTASSGPAMVPGQGWGAGGVGPGQSTFGPFRMFAPGMFSQQSVNLNQMPNGVSVSIEKQNNEPAHITVHRGNDTWNIVGDDPDSLAQLPEDVRPFVEQMMPHNGQMQVAMPVMPNMPQMPQMPTGMPGMFHDEAMQQQLQRMEQHLQQMQQQMEQQFGPIHNNGQNQSGTDASSDAQ
jgi:serine protease Do